MKRPSRAALRRRAPKLPIGALHTYVGALRRALAAQQRVLIERVMSRYQEPPERADAAADASADGSLSVPIEVPHAVLDTVGGRVARKVASESKRLIGISRERQGADRAMVDAWRRRNVGLIKSIESEQHEQIRSLLAQATEEGWHSSDLRRELQGRFDVARSRADLIARDQTLKLNAQLTQHTQTSVGITSYVWSTSSDERVRPSHAKLDGERCDWSDPPETNDDGDHNHPGEDYQCRCVAVAIVPWLEGEDEEGEAA